MPEIQFTDQVSVELVTGEYQESATDLMVCKAAWVSTSNATVKEKLGIEEYYLERRAYYGQTTEVEEAKKKMSGLINFLYRNRHMSPFEHGHLTFSVDCPIFVAREFMRHRTLSYNETSGRYRELEPRFFLVGSERPLQQVGKVGHYRFEAGTDEQYGTVFAETTAANGRSWTAYQNMLAQGVAKEVARNVLPVNIMTQFYVTGNPRNWLQFLALRDDDNALAEIRQVAQQIAVQFEKQMPLTYAAYKKYDWRDERAELELLRAQVAQHDAYETYAENIRAGARARRPRRMVG